MACKSTQTEHCEYITDEDIISELYSHRQREGEAYRNHKTEKVTDEMGICCCQGWSLMCTLLVFQKHECCELKGKSLISINNNRWGTPVDLIHWVVFLFVCSQTV